jgi:enoyl-CoA hydratase/carnithine racemase
VPRRIGYLRATEIILLGQPFDAARADELGFLTAVVPDQALLPTATETAQKLAERPASALRACKKLLKRSLREQLEHAVDAEIEEFTARLRSVDTREAITAFFEKRQPDFTKTKDKTATDKVA